MPFNQRVLWRAPRLMVALLGSIALIATSALPTASATAETSTTSLAAVASTYTSTSARARNYNTSSVIKISPSKYRGYVQFSVVGVDLPKLVKAELLITPKKVKGVKKVVVRSVSANSIRSVTPDTAPKVGSVIGKSTKLRTGKRIAIALTDLTAVKSTTALALNLASGSTISLYKTGTKAPSLRLTTSATTTTSAATPTPTTTTGTATVAEAAAINIPAPSAHKKLVFAHYFPPYPVSMDNSAPVSDYYSRHYLNPAGENGKFAAVGGLLRDRPIPRDPISGDYKLENMKSEVRQAMAAGIDGFAVDILNVTGSNWDATIRMLKAAAAVSPSFKIMLQPDMTASTGSLSAEAFATSMASLSGYSSVYKVNSKVVLSPFKAEAKTVAWWTSAISALKNTHGVSASLLPVFLNVRSMSTYNSISIGFGEWGARNPDDIQEGANQAANAHALGKLWMQPVAAQDARPVGSVYDEAGNTETLRLSWEKAIRDGADMVLLATWNDYSETTSFAPSKQHGWSILDISAYYMARFQTGAYKPIVRDGLYLSHRIHNNTLKPTNQTSLMQLWSGDRTAPRNTVEVLSLLTTPGTVSVVIGGKTQTYAAPAGVYAKTFSLAAGSVSASLVRNSSTVAKVRTATSVKSTIATQDLGYHMASSLRTLPRQV